MEYSSWFFGGYGMGEIFDEIVSFRRNVCTFGWESFVCNHSNVALIRHADDYSQWENLSEVSICLFGWLKLLEVESIHRVSVVRFDAWWLFGGVAWPRVVPTLVKTRGWFDVGMCIYTKGSGSQNGRF